jgi:FkbM family methyltransferase
VVSARGRIAIQLMRWPWAYAWSRRAFFLAHYLLRRPHEADFAAFAAFPSEGLFLDVGANSGMSAMSFRIYNSVMPILSIEANPYHEPDLRFLKRWLRAYDYRIVAAGESSGTLKLHVPFFHGVPLTGMASAVELRDEDVQWWVDEHLGSNARVTFQYSDITVPVTRLDELQLRPTIVKIDVEGYELPVLRGLEQTISSCRPLLLLETPADVDAVAGYLAQWGYRSKRFDAKKRALVPYAPPGVNMFFAPDGGAWEELLTGRSDDRPTARKRIGARLGLTRTGRAAA